MGEQGLFLRRLRPRLEGGGVFLITIRSWLVRRGETKGGKENTRRRKYLGNRILLGRGRKISQSAMIAYRPTDRRKRRQRWRHLLPSGCRGALCCLITSSSLFLPPPSPRSVVFKNIFAHIVWETAGSGGRGDRRRNL